MSTQMIQPIAEHLFYDVVKRDDGMVDVHDFDIFATCTHTGRDGKPYNFDREWLERAAEKMNRFAERGYLAPVHIDHKEKGKNNTHAGFLANYKVRENAEGVPTIFSTLRLFKEIYAQAKENRLPFRSVEINDPTTPAISSLALMATDAPFHKFRNLGSESLREVDGGAAVKCWQDANGSSIEMVQATSSGIWFAKDPRDRRDDDEEEADSVESLDYEPADDVPSDEELSDSDLISVDDESDPFASLDAGDGQDVDPESNFPGDDGGYADDEADLMDPTGMGDPLAGDPASAQGMDPMAQEYATKADLAAVNDKLDQILKISSAAASQAPTPTPSAPVIAKQPLSPRSVTFAEKIKKAQTDLHKENAELKARLDKIEAEKKAADHKFAEAQNVKKIEDEIDAKVRAGLKQLADDGLNFKPQLRYNAAFNEAAVHFSEKGTLDGVDEVLKVHFAEVREELAPLGGTTAAALAGQSRGASANGAGASVKLTNDAAIDAFKDDPALFQFAQLAAKEWPAVEAEGAFDGTRAEYIKFAAQAAKKDPTFFG